MNQKITKIYGVIEEPIKELRYVGKTVGTLRARLRNQLNPRGNSHRANWFRKAKIENISLDIFEIEIIPKNGDWVEAETFWIAYFKSIGANLVNTTPGGEGVIGIKHPELTRSNKARAGTLEWQKVCQRSAIIRNDNQDWREAVGRASKLRMNTQEALVKASALGKSNKGKSLSQVTKDKMRETALKRGPASEETRKKISKANKGRRRSLEAIEKTRQANLGRHHTLVIIEHLREVNVGKILSKTTKEKISLANRGKKRTLEQIEIIRQNSLGRVMPREAVERARQKNLGRKHTPEALQKMREAAARRWGKL